MEVVLKKLFLMIMVLHLFAVTALEKEQFVARPKADLAQVLSKRRKPRSTKKRVFDYGKSKHKKRQIVFDRLRNLDLEDFEDNMIDLEDFEIIEKPSFQEELEQRFIELQQKPQLTFIEMIELRYIGTLLDPELQNREQINQLKDYILNTMPQLQLHEIIEADNYLEQLTELSRFL